MASSEARRSSGLLALILLIQLFAFGLWVGGPRIKNFERCVFNVQLGPHIGHSVNCDSIEFIQASSSPEHIWGPESRRQSRPGTALAVYVFSRPLAWALHSDRTVSVHDMRDGGKVAFVIGRGDLLACYAGYLALHMLILIASCVMYLRLAGIGREREDGLKTAAGMAGLFVFINNITKQFLWSPHTQLFNIMAPLAALYLFKKMRETDDPDRLFFRAALLCGVGMLFYGIFVVPVTVAGLGWLWRQRDAVFRPVTLAKGAGAVVLFALPYAAWVGFILLKNGAFYNYDVDQFQGFVWMGGVWERQGLGGVLYWLGYNVLSMVGGALAQGWGFGLLLAGLVWLSCSLCHPDRGDKILRCAQDDKCGALDDKAKILWIGAGLYVVLASVFYALYGLTVERLSFTLVVTLFPLIGFYLNAVEKCLPRPVLLRRCVLAGLCLYTLFMAAKFGPYS